jgi:excinuclease ABC subunit A
MLTLHGIETNNLKLVDVSIPYGKITAVVGESGAGKTSLAFHTLYALCKNELDTISGVPASLRPKIRGYANLLPAIAVKQKNSNVNPRSSVYTYLGLDKLLLPPFLQTNPGIKGNILAQNNPVNYCQACEGLGVIFRPDPARIVDLDKPLVDKPFLSWNNFLSAHYYPLLEAFCAEQGIDTIKSIRQLTPKQRELLLHGASDRPFQVKYKQKNRYRNKKFPFVGAIREIQDCCDNLQVPGNRQKAKSYLSEQVCPDCHGSRFKDYLAKYTLNGWTIHDILLASFDTLLPFIQSIPDHGFVLNKLTAVVTSVIRNNLGYLSPMRSIPSLSGGEFQRLQLASVLSSDFTNLLYVIDEVSASLHVAEYANVISQLQSLKERNSTLVMVEHELKFIEKADNLIALEKGRVVDSTQWLQAQQEVSAGRVKVEPRGAMDFTVHDAHNICHLEVTIPMGCLIGCCGVSGSGKSSFAESISGRSGVEYIGQGTIQGNSNSTVATYLKLMQPMDSFLCKTLGAPSKTFLFNNSTSQCMVCEGKGYVEQEVSFGHAFRSVCEACEGKRYKPEVLAYRFNSLSIHDILTMTVADLSVARVFKESRMITAKLEDMMSIGLGHLTFFRATSELSGGEAQRIKLLSKMKANLVNTFLIIDEPANGLERQDTKRLIDFLDKLLRNAKGIMVIEHNLFLLKSMDYILEFGPGGGIRGGEIIYQGRIEDMTGTKSILKDFI